jgi:hypothetical protein
VKIKQDGKSYDLLKLSPEDIEELKKSGKNKEFWDFAATQAQDVKDVSRHFTRKIMHKQIFYDAGKDSRDLVWKLIGMLGLLIGLDKYNEKIIKAAGEGKLSKFLDKSFWIIGSAGDDVSGCYKDYFQDKDVLGKKTALWVAWISAAVGVASSVAISDPMKNRLEEMNKKFPSRILPPITKKAIPWVMLFAICSSGSSIASNIGTFLVMNKNHEKMNKQGLLGDDKDKSAFWNIWKNYRSYEAYLGKDIGILSNIPLAILLSGAIFSRNSIIKAGSITLLGTCETLVACAFQKLTDGWRRQQIEGEKRALLEKTA